jgi:hypothetical protein
MGTTSVFIQEILFSVNSHWLNQTVIRHRESRAPCHGKETVVRIVVKRESFAVFDCFGKVRNCISIGPCMHFMIDCCCEHSRRCIPKLYVHIHSCSRSAMR